MARKIGTVKIGITADASQFNTTLAKVKSNTESSANSITGILNTVNTAWLAVGASATLLANEIIKITDTYTLLESRLKIVTTSSENLAFVQNDLFAIAQKTRQEYAHTIEIYTRIARAARDLDVEQTALLSVTELLNEAVIISGSTTEESRNAMIQFSQALSSSRLSGDELRSVLEQIPRVAQMIADGLGVDIGQLRAMGKAGELSSQVVIDAILSQKDTIEKEYANIEMTVEQAWLTLRNQVDKYTYEVNESIGINETLASVISSMASWMGEEGKSDLDAFADSLRLTAQALGDIAAGLLGAIELVGELAGYENAAEYGSMGLLGYILMGTEGALIATGILAINSALEETGEIVSNATGWKVEFGIEGMIQDLHDLREAIGNIFNADQIIYDSSDLEGKIAVLQEKILDLYRVYGAEVDLSAIVDLKVQIAHLVQEANRFNKTVEQWDTATFTDLSGAVEEFDKFQTQLALTGDTFTDISQSAQKYNYYLTVTGAETRAVSDENLALESAYQSLGLMSESTYKQMKQNIIDNYKLIVSSGGDRKKAQAAMYKALKKLDEQYYKGSEKLIKNEVDYQETSYNDLSAMAAAYTDYLADEDAERQEIIQNYTDKYMELTLDSSELAIYQLEQEREAFEKTWDGNQDTLDAFEKYYQAKLSSIEDDTEDTTSTLEGLWTDAWDEIADELSDWVTEGEFSFDDLLDAFIEMLADMWANWVVMLGKMAIEDLFTDSNVDWSEAFSWFSSDSSSNSSSSAFSSISDALEISSLWDTVSSWFSSDSSSSWWSLNSASSILDSESTVADWFSGSSSWWDNNSAADFFSSGSEEGSSWWSSFFSSGSEEGSSWWSSLFSSGSEGGAAASSSSGGYALSSGAASAGVYGFLALEAVDWLFNDGGVTKGIGDAITDSVSSLVGWSDPERDVYTTDDESSESIRVTSSSYFDTEEEYVSNSISELSEQLGDLTAALSSSGTSSFGGTGDEDNETSGFFADTDAIIEKMNDIIDVMADTFGSEMAEMAQSLEATTESFDTFLEALTGVDVSSEDAATALELAEEAFNGSSEAVGELESLLISLGLSEDEAATAAAALISSIGDSDDSLSFLSSSLDDTSDASETAEDSLSSFNSELASTASSASSILSDLEGYASEAEEFVASIKSSTSSYQSSGYSTGGYVSHLMTPGYPTGGAITKLVVPPGDDGLAGLKFGEGVLSHTGMAALEKLNSGGTLGGEQQVVVNLPESMSFVLDDGTTLKGKIQAEADELIVERNSRSVRPTERVAF